MHRAYYAGRRNRFWRILAETGMTPRLLRPEEFILLPSFGIGLTDLGKSVHGADATMRIGDYDRSGLEDRIRACRPALLAFNGKRAAAIFLGMRSGDLNYGDGAVLPNFPSLAVLPSTSGAASGRWIASHWHALARRAKQTRR
jgi:TDG/mug DNA glycosylase family protein